MAESVGLVFTESYRPYRAGERAFFDPEEARRLTGEEGVARWAEGYGPRDAPEAEGEEGPDGIPETTHELNVTEVREVAEQATLDQLVALLESEENHPEYDGGRSTALAALRGEIEDRGED